MPDRISLVIDQNDDPIQLFFTHEDALMVRLLPASGVVAIVLALILSCSPSPPSSGEGQFHIPSTWAHRLDSGKVVASHGMVASDAPLATHAGVSVLRSGGNAVDAAVATAFALAVTMPVAGNIGGGGFIVLRMADGTTASLDFREAAPRKASRNMYLDAQGRLTDQSLNGHLAAGVPGTVAGLWEAHRKFGTRPWAELVAPSIALAESGFVVSQDFAQTIRGDSARLVRFPESARLFFPHGRIPGVGDLWKNPDLAETLRRIVRDGAAGFYQGRTAGLILEEMRRGKGIITQQDLAEYRAFWRTPIEVGYHGYRIISMPPPSSGGITLTLLANMLEQYNLGERGWHSAQAIHLVVEAMRRAYADRNYYLGDPGYVTMPLDTLRSKAYAERRGSTIRLDRATPSSEVAPGPMHSSQEGMHTTHFSVVDGAGNAVALTTTVNTGFGSAVTVSGAGFVLNNEMDDFAAKPGSQNTFGLVQGEANAIQPGKRMLSSMAPTVVLNPQGKVMLMTGASGGPRITTTVFQIISNMIDFRMDAAEATSAPRFHHQHLPDAIMMEEGGFSTGVIDTLHLFGHQTRMIHHLAIAASIARKDSVWEGRSDPRVGGSAEGY